MASEQHKLTVIIPCFNEERNLADCVASARFADEILVVDSFSTDGTLQIARDLNVRLIQNTFRGHGAQINWALPQATHPWILVVDADERVSPELAVEIRSILQNPACDGYWMPRTNIFIDRQIRHGTWGDDEVLRLFHRAKGRYEEKLVHSKVILQGSQGRCKAALIHYSYRSLDDFVRKIDRFTRGGARVMFDRKVRASGSSIFVHSVGRFLKSYVLKRGFLDGTRGLIIAGMEASDAFLKYARLWELHNRKD